MAKNEETQKLISLACAAIVLIFAVVVGLLLSGGLPQQAAPYAAPTPAVFVIRPSVVPTAVPTVPVTTVYTAGAAGMVSSAACANGKLSLTLTNIERTSWAIGTDVTFYVNTVTDSTPGCGKSTLAPGESTTCTTLDSSPLGYTPSLIVKTPENRDVRKVPC